jgi:hypothetical protein
MVYVITVFLYHHVIGKCLIILNSFFLALQAKKVFQAFNSSLQILSAIFEEMKKFSPDIEDRYKIIDSIHSQLVQVRTNNENT